MEDQSLISNQIMPEYKPDYGIFSNANSVFYDSLREI